MLHTVNFTAKCELVFALRYKKMLLPGGFILKSTGRC